MFTLAAAGITDTGRIRTNNEDSFRISGNLLVVADGMGGAAAGEVASSIAVDTVVLELADLSSPVDDHIAQNRLTTAIAAANTAIVQRIASDPALEGMGTTMVIALHLGDRVLLGNVGDSRAYLVSDAHTAGASPSSFVSSATATTGVMQALGNTRQYGEGERIVRLTKDHSVVMEMVASGVIEERDIRTHPMRNRITRCLGSAANSDPDCYWHTIAPGDTLVLCSDGLWEMVHEDLILAIVNSSTDLDDIARRLVTAANNSGGVDNITAIVARFASA